MGVPELQVVKFGPLIKLVESEFGFKPFLYTSFFGGNQEEGGLVNVIENFLKKTDHYELAAIDAIAELAAIDAIAATAHSLITAIGVFRGRLSIEQAIELIRLEEDSQVDRWGLVEGGHDVDIADLKSPNLIRWCLSQTFKACCLNYNQQEKGRPLPKFGEWDVNNPASADGFTVIFAKARDEKKAKGTAASTAPPPSSDSPQTHDNQNKKKWLCCF